MHMFASDSFDFAVFAFNSLDCMSHNKRLQILSEIYRVLKPVGLFAFSSHNLDYKDLVVGYNKRDINLFRNIKNLVSYFKVKDYQVFGENYAVLSDPLAGFGHLIYNIRPPEQVKQLESFGFQNISIINRKAQFTTAEVTDPESNFLHYVCNK